MIECISLNFINQCIFILVFFKNDIDCMIIDSPLNEIMPEVRAIEIVEISLENDLQPLVTSRKP